MSREEMKLYYENREREFYFVTKRPKSILIEWAEHKTPEAYNGKGEIIQWFYHKFNVKWDNDFVSGKGMVVKTNGKNNRHCLSEYEDDYILIYPYQAGQPFSLELATEKNIKKERDYHSSSSNEYYDNLSRLLTSPPLEKGKE